MDLLAFLNDVVTVLAQSPWIYAVIFAVCVIDGFFPPIPSESVVVAAATIAAATGTPHLLPLIAVAAAGAFVGDTIAYSLGRRIGVTRWRWMRTKRAVATLGWARRGLDSRGALLIFTARYIPVGRVAVNTTAGATRYPAPRFLGIAAAAAVTWAAYSTLFGLVAGQWLHEQPLLAVVLAIALAMAVGALADVVIRRFVGRSTPAPAPVTAPERGDSGDGAPARVAQ